MLQEWQSWARRHELRRPGSGTNWEQASLKDAWALSLAEEVRGKQSKTQPLLLVTPLGRDMPSTAVAQGVDSTA
jgi:hypothetical protein